MFARVVWMEPPPLEGGARLPGPVWTEPLTLGAGGVGVRLAMALQTGPWSSGEGARPARAVWMEPLSSRSRRLACWSCVDGASDLGGWDLGSLELCGQSV